MERRVRPSTTSRIATGSCGRTDGRFLGPRDSLAGGGLPSLSVWLPTRRVTAEERARVLPEVPPGEGSLDIVCWGSGCATGDKQAETAWRTGQSVMLQRTS